VRRGITSAASEDADTRPEGEPAADLKPAPARKPKPRHAVDSVVSAIGPKLRELRLQRGQSLQQLAERSGVSPAAIHKVERSGMVPTIATLMKLAVALNQPVSYLIEETLPEGPVLFIPAGTGRPVYTSRKGLKLSSITGPYGRFYIAGALGVAEPWATSGEVPMEHPGEELIYLLSGAFEVEIDGRTFRLKPGDTIHFRTDRPHRWRNPNAQPAKCIWMTQRPT